MPIQPIDLQTLFMRMSQIGKEQALAKEAAHLAQEAQGSELARRAEEQAHTVNETRDLEQGPDSVKEDEENATGKPSEEEERRRKRRKSDGAEDEDLFKDPDLGNNVDISG